MAYILEKRLVEVDLETVERQIEIIENTRSQLTIYEYCAENEKKLLRLRVKRGLLLYELRKYRS